MRTHPTKATLLATTKAVILRLANHPGLSAAQQQRTLARLPKLSCGQALYCAGSLQLRTEWRPDALRQVVARTKSLNGRRRLLPSPAYHTSAIAWYAGYPDRPAPARLVPAGPQGLKPGEEMIINLSQN
jgi:hypothetical protein